MNPSPKPFEIKQLTKEDISAFNSLIDLFNLVFEEEPKIRTEAHLLKLLGSNKFHCDSGSL